MCIFQNYMRRVFAILYNAEKLTQRNRESESKLVIQTHSTIQIMFIKKISKWPHVLFVQKIVFYSPFYSKHRQYMRTARPLQTIYNWNWFTVCLVDVSASRWFLPSKIVGWITERSLCTLNMSEINSKIIQFNQTINLFT